MTSSRPATTSRHAHVEEGPEDCETLVNLFAGPTGPVHLGRCLGGEDDGRIVLLRRVMATEVAELEEAIERARRVASPELVKVLGLLCRGRARYVASEYIEGVALWELEDEQHLSHVPPDVAARVIRDALVGASRAAEQMQSVGVRSFQRYIFADTVWIGEFGSALLTEVGIAQRISLASFMSGEVRKGQFSYAPETDVQAAAMELKRLLVASTARFTVPRALSQIAERGLSRSRREAFPSVDAMAEVLSALHESVIASEERVSKTMHDLLKPKLDIRRRRLKEVLGSGFVALDDPTASYRSVASGPDTLQADPNTNEVETDEEQTRLYRPSQVLTKEEAARARNQEDSGAPLGEPQDRHASLRLELTLDTDTPSAVSIPEGIELSPSEQIDAGADAAAPSRPSPTGSAEASVVSEGHLARQAANRETTSREATSREAMWRTIAICSLLAVIVLCGGRWLRWW